MSGYLTLRISEEQRDDLVSALDVYALHVERNGDQYAGQYETALASGKDARAAAVRVAAAMLERRRARQLAQILRAATITRTVVDTAAAAEAIAEAVDVLAQPVPLIDPDMAEANIERTLTLVRGEPEELDPNDPEESA